jgi:hypothetical protein
LSSIGSAAAMVVLLTGFTPSQISRLHTDFLMGVPRFCNPQPLDEENRYLFIETGDATCGWQMPNAVYVEVKEFASVTLDVFELKGLLTEGAVDIQTTNLPFTLENSGHVVDPEVSVKAELQTDLGLPLLVLRSVNGGTWVYSCSGENASCSNRQEYYIQAGELLALKENGDWYGLQDPTGEWHYPEGCAAGKSAEGLFLLSLLMLLIACRRRFS